MAVVNSRIKEIDISRPARALRFLRMTDYLLVFICGRMVVGCLLGPIIDPEQRTAGSMAINFGLFAPVLSFLVYTGWRHVGVIDARVWRAYLFAFSLLLLVSLIMALGVSVTPEINEVVEQARWYLVILLSIGSVMGFGSILLLRTMRIANIGFPLVELLRDLNTYKGQRAISGNKIKRIDSRRGVVLGALGGSILLGVSFAPMPSESEGTQLYFQVLQLWDLFACFLLVRARRYFQVSAAALLNVDKRKPILFLRSFEDEEKIRFRSSGKALLDFSLETRLSNHFIYFGPFVAIGSPHEPLPQIGAARTILSDAEWQPRVMGWMEAARVIVMYAGKSQWVNWELAKVVNTARVPKFILMMPEVKGWRRSVRTKDIAARIQFVKEAFKRTKWRAALDVLPNFQEVRSMLFRSDGSVIVVTSRARNRDAYHLAALIAHYIILKDTVATLVGVEGMVKGKQFRIDTDAFHIGSGPDNNLVIDRDRYVSRRHAFLRYDENKLWIVDQRSTNGTFVNGERLPMSRCFWKRETRFALAVRSFRCLRQRRDNNPRLRDVFQQKYRRLFPRTIEVSHGCRK